MEALQAPKAQEIEVVIADHDGATALYHLADFVTHGNSGVQHLLQGYGETARIHAGKIIAITSGKEGYRSIPGCLTRLLNT